MGENPKGKVPRKGKYFRRAAVLVEPDVRRAGEARGFAESRVLTHWREIAGEEMAAKARPVKISYSQGGFGGTLMLLTRGADAPMVEMEAERLRQKVNACYGYNAVTRIRITQTAPEGFAEGQAVFAPAPKPETDPAPDPKHRERAARETRGIGDDALRSALETLGASILSRQADRNG